MSIHSLVVETPTRRIVVDTGLGNDKEGRNVPTWNNRQRPFLETMTAAGFPPDSIDTVLCTHLHVDHVGWNTRLDRRPMGADLRQCALCVRQDRIRALARPQRRARQDSGFQRLGEADRRRRQGRPRRQRRQAVRRNHPDPDARPQPGPYEHSDPVGRRSRACSPATSPIIPARWRISTGRRPPIPIPFSRRRRGANCSRALPIRRRW